MYSDSLGAAAGCAPERSSLTGGVPSVSNAGVVGGVIHLAAVLRVAHVRLRRAMEHAVQRRVPAPRDLPERFAIKVKIKKKKPTQLQPLSRSRSTPWG